MNTKNFFCLMVAFVSVVLLQPVAAQDWPKAPVRIVVPYPPGAGATDILARKLGEKLGSKWGQPVVIDNKPGAVEIIGTTAVVQAKPDGYTLLLSTDSSYLMNQFLFNKLPYDSVKDLTPIIRIGESPFMYLVRSDSRFQSLIQLINQAKESPGKITYGSSGPGGPQHIAVNWLGLKAGNVQMLQIPYKGGPVITQALLAGEIDFTGLSPTAVQAFLADKRMRPLAVSSATRLRAYPDIPTTTELGYTDTVYSLGFGICGPGRLPMEIANLIARDVAAILKDPQFASQVTDPFGMLVIADTPAEFAKFLVADREKQRERVRATNVKLD